MSIPRKRSHSVNALYENNTCDEAGGEQLLSTLKQGKIYRGGRNYLDIGPFCISFCCLDPLHVNDDYAHWTEQLLREKLPLVGRSAINFREAHKKAGMRKKKKSEFGVKEQDQRSQFSRIHLYDVFNQPSPETNSVAPPPQGGGLPAGPQRWCQSEAVKTCQPPSRPLAYMLCLL